ncbi:MAG: DUF4331 domain-containing protein [Abyssibacter sp.]|jgi:hypothetical protein|nr:DUF4331 domain-containing protein [Abyssibacter sp.]MCK5859134.1 DUF4331 domain-containing protein [Abyssibacter sp.]
MRSIQGIGAAAVAGIALATAAGSLYASSHREAPGITETPKVDGTDFYMFNSYEEGRSGFVTLIANYVPLQDAYGGPNYFSLDDKALYEIHVDNDGDNVEDLTFQFRFTNTLKGVSLPVGPDGVLVPIPLIQAGGIGPNPGDTGNLNLEETFSVTLVRGDRRAGTAQAATNVTTGGSSFRKPTDYIGTKTFPDYQAYANAHIWEIAVPGCQSNGKVFVGQRKEGFVVNLGQVFDLVNLNPLGAPDAVPNTIGDKNVTSIALELPASCLTAGDDPVIGGWTTASLRQARVANPFPQSDTDNSVAPGTVDETVEGGPWTQVSRLGAPLVNEVVIGIDDKNRFNASEPKDDGQFAKYVLTPTLPELLEILFAETVTGDPNADLAPNAFPRADLAVAFLTGVPGLNQPAAGAGGPLGNGTVLSEQLRLNTTTAPVAAAAQDPLGVLAGDAAGFPNGRRPGDDVVDAALRVAMGALCELDNAAVFGCGPDDAPVGDAPLTDQSASNASQFDSNFPYLRTPLPGSR